MLLRPSRAHLRLPPAGRAGGGQGGAGGASALGRVRTLKDLKVGVAAETAEGEARVALLPSNVETLKKRYGPCPPSPNISILTQTRTHTYTQTHLDQ